MVQNLIDSKDQMKFRVQESLSSEVERLIKMQMGEKRNESLSFDGMGRSQGPSRIL